jgi:hypothetical protein
MNDKEALISKSTAQAPDLDWSQIRETVLMLNLAVAQIGRAMNDGDESVGTLTNSFTTMAGNTSIIAEAGEKLPDSPEKDAILSHCQQVTSQMQSAIIAFQFYDKLTQQLNHAGDSLASLAELVSTPGSLYSPYEWRGLQEKIRSKYTNESDKKMFDAILNGATVEEALQQALSEDASEDVELF